MCLHYTCTECTCRLDENSYICNPKPSVFSLTTEKSHTTAHQLCCVTVTQLSYSVPLCPSIISRVTVTQLPACVLLFKVCHAMELNHSTDLEIQYSPGIFSFSHYHCGHTGMEANFPCQITSGVCVQLPCQHL